MSKLRYEEQTYELRGLIFELRKTLKTGWPEEVYHQGFVQLLQEKNIPVYSKPRKSIVHRGVEVHLFECDLLVWDLIILELKVLPFTNFSPAHQAQIIHYLKCWRKELGLLVADKYLLNIRSVLERPPPYEFIRTRTYLGVLGLQFGFVVNFGKKQLQIYGIQAT